MFGGVILRVNHSLSVTNKKTLAGEESFMLLSSWRARSGWRPAAFSVAPCSKQASARVLTPRTLDYGILLRKIPVEEPKSFLAPIKKPTFSVDSLIGGPGGT